MARLSAKNFKNSKTAGDTRRSSRFRELFKGNRLRVSTNSHARSKSTETSPAGADHQKSGFYKVGLHPSERSPWLGVDELGRAKETADKESMSTSKSLAEEYEELKAHAKMSAKLKARGAEDVSKPTRKEYNEKAARNAIQPNSFKSMTDHSLSYEEKARMIWENPASYGIVSEVLPQARSFPDNEEQSEVLYRSAQSGDDIEYGSDRKSSNIQWAKNAAVGSGKTDKKDAAGLSEPRGPDDEVEVLSHKTLSTHQGGFAPLAVGPFYISNPQVASFTHCCCTITYLTILFVAALLGPKTFFLALWRLAVPTIGYMVIYHKYELQYENGGTDLHLLIAQEITKPAFDFGISVLREIMKALVPLIASFIRDIIEEYERLIEERGY